VTQAPGTTPAGQPTIIPPPVPGGPIVRPPQPQPTPTPGSTATNPYSAGQACGSGYGVIDSHSLGGATVYLLYNGGNGDNCVVTLVDHPNGAVPMNATLAVQGGSSGGNPGNFTYYAGPVIEHASRTCVQWGGSFQGVSWTSGWSHCG
jgi:hypothetical protein